MTKNTRSKWPLILAGLILLWVIGNNPENTFGILFFGVGAIYFGNKWLRKPAVDLSKTSQPKQKTPSAEITPARRMIPPSSNIEASSGYRIPLAPQKPIIPGRWVPPGESIEINGVTIAGGMLYVGTSLPASNGLPDPALIDPTKNIAKIADFSERLTNYWPSYSDVSPQARKAYLNWLIEGKSHPDADIGYVFMYFYGLERRVLVDGVNDIGDAVERSQIANEITRLISVYNSKSSSFTGYASRLLAYLELAGHPPKLYQKAVPKLALTAELPYYLRLAIGQAAVDSVPVPAHIAIAWVRSDPAVFLRTPATRCKEEFDTLFLAKYIQLHGDGLKISANRTKLKFAYYPASAGLRDVKGAELSFGDTPDITALTAPVKKLQAIVDMCTDALDSYSRFLGRNPDKMESVDALLQLPVLVWPQKAKEAIQLLKDQTREHEKIFSLSELALTFGDSTIFTRDSLRGLARALESEKIGIEPDVLSSSKTLKLDDRIVLFTADNVTQESRDTSAYQVAMVTLQLAAAVAHADGDFSQSEVSLLEKQVDSWGHLALNHRRRLKAYIQLLTVEPVSLASLKKKIEPLDTDVREAIAHLAAVMAQADGTVAHQEIQLLEKIYKLLGVDQKKVYTNVHASATSGSTTSPNKESSNGFVLDTAKIAALQEDSAKIATLLGNIFNEDFEPQSPLPIMDEEDTPSNVSQILGLDGPHSAFARILVSRPTWSRGELTDVANDLEIMLDGALERLNEATLDTYDIPCTDGEDPIEINLEIIEKITS